MRRLNTTNILNGMAFGGVAALVLTGAMTGLPNDGVDPITTASVSAHAKATDYSGLADHFTVIDHAHNRTCVVQIHKAEGYDVHRVEPGATCAALSPELASARVWKENAGGMVTLADLKGHALFKMVRGDGFAWDVIEPARAELSFDAF